MANWRSKYFLLVLSFGLLVIGLIGCGADSGVADRVVVSPTTVLVGQQQKQQFYATVYNASNQVLTKVITWSVTGGIGTIDASGLLYAGSSLVSGTVVAQADSLSGSANVTVTDRGTVSGRITDIEGNRCASITVTLNNLSTLSATSNLSGDYSVSGVPAGTYEVKTRANLNYISAITSEVKVTEGATRIVNLTLIPRISVASDTESKLNNIITLRGRLQNNGSTEAQGVSIIYRYFGEEGNLIGAGNTTPAKIAGLGTLDYSLVITLDEDSYSSRTRTVSLFSY
jgi:hypothetical protein